MAKTKVKPGWVGPLRQANEGKRPFYCDYGDWDTGDKKRQKLGVAGKKKEAEAEWIAFRQRMESKTHTPRSTRTFGDALDEYERWCEERWRLKQKMSGVRLVVIRRIIKTTSDPLWACPAEQSGYSPGSYRHSSMNSPARYQGTT